MHDNAPTTLHAVVLRLHLLKGADRVFAWLENIHHICRTNQSPVDLPSTLVHILLRRVRSALSDSAPLRPTAHHSAESVSDVTGSSIPPSIYLFLEVNKTSILASTAWICFIAVAKADKSMLIRCLPVGTSPRLYRLQVPQIHDRACGFTQTTLNSFTLNQPPTFPHAVYHDKRYIKDERLPYAYGKYPKHS